MSLAASMIELYVGLLPEFLERNGNFNAVGRLGSVQSDVWLFGSHG